METKLQAKNCSTKRTKRCTQALRTNLNAQTPRTSSAQTLRTNLVHKLQTQTISKHKQLIYSDPAIVIVIPQGRFKFESPPDFQIHANAETHAF